MTYEESPRWLPPTAEAEPPPPPEPPKPREVPVWAPFLGLLVALIVISLFAVVLGAIVSASDPSVDLADDVPLGVQFGVMAFQYVVFATVAIVTLHLALGRVTRWDLGLRRVENVRMAILWAAAVFVGFLAVLYIVSELHKVDDQALVEDVKAEDSVLVLGVYALLICVCAPFFEELFFRGFMFTIVWRKVGPWWAALIVGATFGVLHAGGSSWLSVVALGAFGVGLCLLYWRTGSIVPCMALHALNNSLTFASVKDLDPALFAGVVIISVGVVTGAAAALSSRAAVTA